MKNEHVLDEILRALNAKKCFLPVSDITFNNKSFSYYLMLDEISPIKLDEISSNT